MSGPKRNPDKLNTIGVVVVGICGAVLVYVTITALQAFYMNDTSDVQTMADYGGQDQTYKGTRADQLRTIGEVGTNAGTDTFHIKIEDAMKLVIEDAKKDPSHLTGAKMPASTKASIEPVFGRPKLGAAAPAPAGAGSAAPAPAGAGSAAPAPAGADSGSASSTTTGTGSGAPAGGTAAGTGTGTTAAPQTPTGAGAGAGAAGASPSAEHATGSGGATR